MSFNSFTTVAAGAKKDLTLCDFDAAMREWEALERRMRREGLTIVVVQGHTGPAVIETHPTDGKFAEMSWRQAQRVHEASPLILKEVIARDRAHFRAAHTYDRFVPAILPAPPYRLPSDAEGAS